jgi:predicted transcriptional regulator of viral defense system
MKADYPTRSLSKQEAQVMSWLEAERRSTVTVEDVASVLGWKPTTIRKVLSRLAEKGWLQRVGHGRYESVLAETGGFALPNPWAALSLWQQPYYVGYQSAAYEQGLTSDRPGDVQVCVAQNARRPRAWEKFPIAFVWQRGFTLAGTFERQTHSFMVRFASPERLLVDGAARPSRMGGLPGLVRVLDRAREQVDWQKVVELSTEIPRGRPALKRLASLLTLLTAEVPAPLDRAAAAVPGEHPILLGEKRLHGSAGPVDRRYGVVRNVDPESLREEVRR